MAFLQAGFLLASVFADKTMITRVLSVEPTPYMNFPLNTPALAASTAIDGLELVTTKNKNLLTLLDTKDPLSILDVQFGIQAGIRMWRRYPSTEHTRGNPQNLPKPTTSSPYGYWDSTTILDTSEMQFYPTEIAEFDFLNTTTASITLSLNLYIHQCWSEILTPDDIPEIKSTIKEWYKNPSSEIFRIDHVGGGDRKVKMAHELSKLVTSIPLQEVL